MVALIGYEVRTALTGAINPHLSADLREFAEELFTPRCYVHQRIGSMPRPLHRLAKGLGRAIGAQRIARSYFDQFYNRIHIRPQRLALGNLPSVQTREVEVFNAYFTSQQLEDVVVVNGGGLTVTGPDTLPMTFAALQSRVWQIGIGLGGPPVINTTITWTFGGGISAQLPITGTRITAWTLSPNWDLPVIERLSWLTDVLESPSAASQRIALRAAPRGSYEFAALADGRERALLDLSVYAWGSRVWAVPVWHDVELIRQELTAGASSLPTQGGREYRAGGLAILLGKDATRYEVVEIQELTGGNTLVLTNPLQRDWPRGTKLYPVRNGRLETQPQFNRLTDRMWSTSVRMQLVDPVDFPVLVPATVYRGFPVLEMAPNEVEDLTAQFQRLARPLDNGTGIPGVIDTAGLGLPLQGYRWLCGDRSQYLAMRGLLYGLRGQQRAWWLPTFAQDLELAAPVTAFSQTIDVAWCGYTLHGAAGIGRRDIRIELKNGTALHRRITASQELNEDAERLVLDASLGVNVTPTQVRRISYLVLSRLSQDDVELEHPTDADGITHLAVTFRGVRDDLEVPA